MGEEGEDEGGPKNVGLKELLGISVSITAACIGIITNLISIAYFLRRKNKNLGDKYLILLNTLDITICILATFFNTVALKCDESACGLFPFLENFHVDSSTMFETVVELSSLTTCFLCALRAISISRPLCQISKTKVYLSSALAVIYIIAAKSIISHLKTLGIVGKKDGESHVSSTMKLSLVNTGIMVVFVMICLIVSVRGLKKTRPERSEQGVDTNEKATKMILILGVLFLTFNLVWMAILSFIIETNWLLTKEKMEEIKVPVQVITYAISSINSAANPIVYMTRNEEMKKYITQLLCQVKNFVCRKRPILSDCIHLSVTAHSSRVAISDLNCRR